MEGRKKERKKKGKMGKKGKVRGFFYCCGNVKLLQSKGDYCFLNILVFFLLGFIMWMDGQMDEFVDEWF